jgi:hypothetical protein
MKKTAIKLTILSIIFLVSTSGIVLGTVYNNTNMSNENSASYTSNITGEQNTSDVVNDTSNVTGEQSISDVVNDTSNVTGEQSAADNVNVTSTESGTSTTGDIVDTTTPQETVPLPTKAPKSPGFESIGAVALLLLAMYVSKRK